VCDKPRTRAGATHLAKLNTEVYIEISGGEVERDVKIIRVGGLVLFVCGAKKIYLGVLTTLCLLCTGTLANQYVEGFDLKLL
jgi:hypothetical protein